MKNLLLILFIAISSLGFSQEMLTEGVVKSKQTMSTENAELQGQLAMIGDIMTTTYFKGNKTRSETNNFMTGSSVVIMDNDNNQMLMTLNNQMMGKKYVIQTMEPSEEDMESVKVTKGDSTKNVLGYECQEYQDRKSTRLNSSHVRISYAVFCLKKKKKITI